MDAPESPGKNRDTFSGAGAFDSSNRLDDALEARLLEWENLYSHPNFVTTYSDFQLPSDLSQSEKYLLAAQWLKDGLSGRKIDFPQSSFELRCFKFARSRSTLALFSIACFVHLTLPFLYPQMCPYEMATSGALVDFKASLFDNYPTVETLMAIEFLICIVYAIELGSRLLVNNLENIKSRRLRFQLKDTWTTVRLVCVSAIFLELLISFKNSFPYRFTFALIPVVYASRRKNLRNMLQGMFIAMTQTYSIMLLLILTIAIWGYSGFLIFRNFDSVEKNRFETIFESVLTGLRVFASRTFAILAINPYYEQSHISAIFFVSLTIGADLLAGSLLIAVGTRAYRHFANQVYTRQMKKRRYAMCAIHKLLAKDGFLHLSDWLKMSSKVTGRYHLSRKSAKALFIYECANANDVCLDIRHFFRLVGLATGNIIISIDEDSDAFIIRETETKIKSQTAIIISDKHKLSDVNPARDSSNFDELVGKTEPILMKRSLLANGIDKSDFQSEKGEIDQESLVRNRNAEVESMHERMTNESRSQQHLVKQLAGKFREDESGNLEFVATDGRITSRVSKDLGDLHANVIHRQVPDESPKTRTDSINELRFESEPQIEYEAGGLPVWKSYLGLKFHSYVRMNHLFCNTVVHYTATVSKCNFKFNLNLFETFYHLVRVMLALELTYATQYEYSDSRIIAAGAIFELLFWIEMFFRMGSFHSLGTYLRMTSKRIQVSINVSSLLLGMACGFRFTDTNPVAICFIIIQILRFFRAYQFLDGFYTYEAMIPVFANVAFLMFSVIYFFSSFAHNRFCSALVPENSDADDDSGAWASYKNQLNFNTFAQSLYTLFQLAVVGSWNMVASTAAKKFPTSSFLFFYSYRLFMTLTVMPILFSFIIQIFIIRRDLEEQNKRAAAPPEEPFDSQAIEKGEETHDSPASSALSSMLMSDGATELSKNSKVDNVSSFISMVASHHPNLGLGPSSFLRGESRVDRNRSTESTQSDTLKNVHQSRRKTRIATFSTDQEIEMMGTMWSSDPMLLKRRPPEVLESENEKLRELLTTAVRLLRDQKVDSQDQMNQS